MAYSILVIDDEALTLRTISRALREEEFDVFVAMSGEEGLKVLAEERPDMALLDVVLPGIDGIEVLRQIKKQSPNTIVVMMSAYRMVDRAVEAMKSGAARHAHDQVGAGEDVTGWTADHRDLVAAVCEAAADVVAKLAPKGKARVSANGDATHANVSVQVLR